MNKFRNDMVLLAGILLVSLILWLIPRSLPGNALSVAVVYQDGQRIGSYLLTQDLSLTIPYGKQSGYNLLSIREGRALISDADCPDRLCVRQHAIGQSGESIICLPHKLVIQIESGKERELDAVTY